jgi:hypothetical protein
MYLSTIRIYTNLIILPKKNDECSKILAVRRAWKIAGKARFICGYA